MPAYIEHVNMTVRNLDEAIRFLITALPEFAVRHRAVTDGQEWAHVGDDRSYLALTQASDRQMSELNYGTIGFNHVGVVVDDASRVAKALRDAGYHEGFQVEPHPHRIRVYFHDADDTEWEFVQYLSDDTSQQNDYSS